MTRSAFFHDQLKEEAIATRKMLAAVPNDKFDWKPHPKSMSIRQLATHIADLPAWPEFAVNNNGLDFAAMEYTPKEANDSAELVKVFDDNLKTGLDVLQNTKEELF